MWPHFDAVSNRCVQLFQDYKQGLDIAKYTTNGTEDRRVEIKKTKRNDSPTKTHGTTGGSKGGNWKNNSQHNFEEPSVH